MLQLGYLNVTRLNKTKTIVAVNGQFPGPDRISIILVACFNGCPRPQAWCFAAAVKLGRRDSVHQSMPTWLWRNFHSSLQSDRTNGYYSVACTHHLVACHTLWASHHSPSRQSALSLGSSACVQYSHPCWYISNSSHCNLEPILEVLALQGFRS